MTFGGSSSSCAKVLPTVPVATTNFGLLQRGKIAFSTRTEQCLPWNVRTLLQGQPRIHGRFFSSLLDRSRFRGGANAITLSRAAPTANELAGYLPRPQDNREKPKRNRRTAKIMFWYVMIHAVPVSIGLWYFQSQKEERIRHAIVGLSDEPGDIAREAVRIIKSSLEPFLVIGGGDVLMQRVDCIYPECNKRKEPTAVGNLISPELEEEMNSLFSLGATEKARGEDSLRYIHFGIARNSEVHERLSATNDARKHALFYQSVIRQAYCTLNGEVSLIEDPIQKQRYWNPRFLSAIQRPIDKPWRSNDWLLVRFEVTECDLKTSFSGTQWESKKLRRDDEWKIVRSG